MCSEVRGTYSVEVLVHYSCGSVECRKWWTVGDGRTDAELTCPHCGTRQAFAPAPPLGRVQD